MKIETPADLKKVIAICRATGVELIKIGDIEIHLGLAPQKATGQSKPSNAQIAATLDTHIPSDELSPEAMLFYSVQENMQNEQQ